MSFVPVWDITTFRARYTMFSSISDAVLNDLWIEAVDFGKPIISRLNDDATQQHYYYVVEAHLAELERRGGINGVLNSSTQGTVSAGFEVDKSNSLLWWNQTRWGAKIAQLIKSFGGFRFIPGYRCHGYNQWGRQV